MCQMIYLHGTLRKEYILLWIKKYFLFSWQRNSNIISRLRCHYWFVQVRKCIISSARYSFSASSTLGLSSSIVLINLSADKETQAWPRVYEVYGTAIGIVLKSMYFKQPPNIPGNVHSWLLELGLPLDKTKMILEDHYCRNPNFYKIGYCVCQRRPRELKQRLRTGVEAASWPGGTDFSELRVTFELLRRKVLELFGAISKYFSWSISIGTDATPPVW